MQGNLRMPVQVSRPGMAIIDAEGNIIDRNSRFCWLVDIPEDARPGRLDELIDCSANQSLLKAIEALSDCACPESVSMELKVCTTTHNSKLSARVARLPGESGHSLLILEDAVNGQCVDTLQWTSTQWAMRSRFDHDFRSRLNVIFGYCSMLMEDLSERDDTSEMVEDLKCIVGAGNDLLSLNCKNSDLLSLSEGTWETNREEILPANVLADVVKELRGRFSEHEFHLEVDDASVLADGELMSKLIGSIIFKLCQETSAGSRIRISASMDTEYPTYRILVTCMPVGRGGQDREKLRNLIDQTLNRIKSDSSVPNLDLFYADTLCELMGTRLQARFDDHAGKASYKIELPTSADYGERLEQS